METIPTLNRYVVHSRLPTTDSIVYRIKDYYHPVCSPCVSPYSLYNTESLINEFTNKYIAFTAYLKSGGLETKDNYLRETL